MIGLMKDEKDTKVITKFAATVPKSCSYCAQKVAHEIEDSELIRVNGIKQLVSKEFRFFYWEKCAFDSINVPITKQQVSFRSIKHVIYNITKSKVALPKLNDQEVLDEDWITTYPPGSNLSFINCFNDKDYLILFKNSRKYI